VSKHLLGFSGLAAALLFAGAAHALCQQPKLGNLQREVNAACKQAGAFSCKLSQSCAVLKSNKAKALRCAASRETINSQCFGGGDDGHKTAASNARAAEAFCQAKIVQKPCP
jgi:hypothetical protein